jgi:hypothetical protein
MISSEAQRTLVKSPPELWAELSDPASLARHLGELGEIEIVRTEPESIVEWTAANTTGIVSISPAGWGTRVTLKVTRELEEASVASEREPAPHAQAEPVPIAAAELQPSPAAEPQPVPADEPEPTAAMTREPQRSPAAEPQPVAVDEPEPVGEPAREPRRSFLARLFRRFTQALDAEPIDTTAIDGPTGPSEALAAPAEEPAIPAEAPSVTSEAPTGTVLERSEQADAFAAVSAAIAPDRFAATHLFATRPALESGPATVPAVQAPPNRTTDIAAELLAAEEVAQEEVTAVLTAVLDRLGAAHHRPFSRA